MTGRFVHEDRSGVGWRYSHEAATPSSASFCSVRKGAGVERARAQAAGAGEEVHTPLESFATAVHEFSGSMSTDLLCNHYRSGLSNMLSRMPHIQIVVHRNKCKFLTRET